MKLNYKRTILVGFAFFLISAFWQAYDATIPVILTNKFGMSQFWSGFVMALDNILAVFMLPMFGALSDKSRSKRGKRTPFITLGTVIAAVALLSLSFIDNSQLKNISAVSKIDDPAALEIIYDSQYGKELKTPEGDEFVLDSEFLAKEDFTAITSVITVLDIDNPIWTIERADPDFKYTDGKSFKLSEVYTQEAFEQMLKNVKSEDTTDVLRNLYMADLSIEPLCGKGYVLFDTLTEEEKVIVSLFDDKGTTKDITHPYYTNYVVPARQAFASERTSANPMPLILFIAVLLVVLVAMATFRSPAVALMPDVTVKPLRSKGNAIINLMGTAGGILVLVLGIVFATSAARNQLMSYNVYYAVIAGLMLLSLVIFLLTVRETKWAQQMRDDSIKYGIEEETQETDEKRKLSTGEVRSLLFILASIALWYFGYNAVTSKYSVYAGNILNMDYNTTLLIAQAAAIVAYLPAGIVASKIGRKKTIIAGVIMLTGAFAAASFLRAGSSVMIMNALFALAGIGWATINVNSFPMVVEMCSGGDVGKYTGFYYTASMSAQIVTPLLSGFFMDRMGMTVLFPYAAIFAGLALVTMIFTRHGDAKPESKKGLEALDVED